MTTATKERRLIVKEWEAKAILSGRKTQMRRPIDCGCNQKHLNRLLGDWGCSVPPYRFKGSDRPWNWHSGRLPVEGDWIEEVQIDVDDAETCPVRCPFGNPGDRVVVRESIWKDQRISLELIDIRVERIREINYRDCIAEGMPPVPCMDDDAEPQTILDMIVGKFRETIDPGIWDSNVWVWIPTFRVIKD